MNTNYLDYTIILLALYGFYSIGYNIAKKIDGFFEQKRIKLNLINISKDSGFISFNWTNTNDYIKFDRFGKIISSLPLHEGSKKFWELVEEYCRESIQKVCVEKMTLEEYKREFADLLEK